VFYALGQSRTPVAVSVATVLLNAALNLWLVQVMGYRGLALGTSIAALFNAALLMFLLRRRLDGIEGGRVAGSMARIVIASALMGSAAMAADTAIGVWLPGGGLMLQVVRLAATIGAALCVLSAAAYILRIREFREGLALVTRKLRAAPR